MYDKKLIFKAWDNALFHFHKINMLLNFFQAFDSKKILPVLNF